MNESFNIAIYDLEGNYLTTVFGNKEAEELTGAKRANISKCVNGQNVQSCNFQFRRLSKSPIRNIGDVSSIVGGNDLRPVAKYFENKLISTYKSLKEAEEKNGIARGSIYNSCEKGHKSGVYNFKFI